MNSYLNSSQLSAFSRQFDIDTRFVLTTVMIALGLGSPAVESVKKVS